MEVKTRRMPLVIGDSASMTNEQWLMMRKRGIGGSDAAAVLNASAYKNAYTLYLDKTNPFVDTTEPDNWFTLEFGKVVEPLARKWYAEKSGYTVVNDTNMYIHPDYSFLLADVDFIAYTPLGEAIIGEIKTTRASNVTGENSPWAPGILGQGGKLPYPYEVQVRHYMAVLDIDRAIVICCYGNSENDFVAVQVYRDLEFEKDLLAAEYAFWNNYVMKLQAPPMFAISNDALKQIEKREYGSGTVEEQFELPEGAKSKIQDYFDLEAEKTKKKKELDALEEKINATKAEIILETGNHAISVFNSWGEGTYVEVTNKMMERKDIDRDKLKLDYRKIYDECCKVTTYPKTTIKVKKKKSSE